MWIDERLINCNLQTQVHAKFCSTEKRPALINWTNNYKWRHQRGTEEHWNDFLWMTHLLERTWLNWVRLVRDTVFRKVGLWKEDTKSSNVGQTTGSVLSRFYSSCDEIKTVSRSRNKFISPNLFSRDAMIILLRCQLPYAVKCKL